MRTPRHRPRRRVATLALTALTALSLAACSNEPEGVDPSKADWPAAVDPATTDGEFVVVWTAIAENADDPALAAEVERLDGLGYEVEPAPASCHSGAAEPLSALTGYEEPVAVGVAFADEEDAGVFDTRDEKGTTVSHTTGTWTC